MKKIFFTISFITSFFASAQKKITVYNLETKQPVAYANIWKENALVKSADSTGSFEVEKKEETTAFKITAIGFNDTIITMDKPLFLRPLAIALEEVKIVKPKNEKKVAFGKAKRGDSHYGVQWDSKIAMTAKFFPNTEKKKLFLSKAEFFASTTTKTRIVSLLFFTVNENGEPGELINTENIICKLKKGAHKVQVDLSRWNIAFPEEGIFVSLQHPLLEQNKVYCKECNHPNAFFYEPLISIDFCDDFVDSWYFKEGKWNKNKTYSLNFGLQLTD